MDSGVGENKALVTTLLWVGAVLAIAGLWWPNWIGALAGGATPFLGLPTFRTPLVTYFGYIILWVACIMVVGIRDSASGLAGWVGLASVILAVLSSVLAQAGISSAVVLLIFTVTSFLATLFIYWTMAKVTEIKRMVKRAVWLLDFVALVLGIMAALAGQPSTMALWFTYTMAGVYALSWLVIAVSVLPTHYSYMMGKRTAGKGT